jgi:two-component system, OmpR family, phosphate regulon sensor histidine kinase PhoR
VTLTSLLLLFLAAAAIALAVLWQRERAQRRADRRRAGDERDELLRRHAKDLRERTGQLERLLDEMPEALLSVNPRGEVQFSNRAASALFSLPPTIFGRPLAELVRAPEIARALTRLRTERELLDFELQIELPVPRELRLSATHLSEGGVVLVFQDLTTLRRLESTRQDFVANVSHELRTPLSLIQSALETLIDGAKEEPDARDKLLGIIDRHAGRLALLIEDLLLLSALDSGRIELRTEVVALNSAVQDVMGDLAQAAATRHVRLRNTVPSSVGVRADGLRLRQILSNLIENAIKYGREGGTVDIAAQQTTRDVVQISVRDDGDGMSEAVRARAFERFFRADKARARQQGGTGLGLSIVKNLVRAHGGEVAVESSPGSGTTFRITLPAGTFQG